MERIRLSKRAKTVLRLLDRGIRQRPHDMNPAEFNVGALELQQHGLAVCHQEAAAGDVLLAVITDLGRIYVSLNPALRNPVNWARLSAIFAAIGVIVSVLAMFVACRGGR